jgi:hypothetical protein
MNNLLRYDFRSKFILHRYDWSAIFFTFQIYFAVFLRSKFILRFDFLNITVRHEIGKRYIGRIPKKKGHYQSILAFAKKILNEIRTEAK